MPALLCGGCLLLGWLPLGWFDTDSQREKLESITTWYAWIAEKSAGNSGVHCASTRACASLRASISNGLSACSTCCGCGLLNSSTYF
jgi:hypothetical protein